MKANIQFAVLLMLMMTACRFEKKVIEETYPDGSPKRVCIYLGSGKNREMIRETTFYPNKKVQMEGTFKNGKRDGKWTSWYENGNVWSEGSFVMGKSDGKRTTYYENGKMRYDGFYKDGLCEGNWRFFFENGKPSYNGAYKKDVRVGKWSFFDEKGHMLQEVDYSAPPK